MATFIDGVNRLLRINKIIRGDDDNITAFTDTQHASDIQMAQIAIQSELQDLTAERLIPYEKTYSTISLTTSTRTYSLASNFIRFYGTNPSFYDATDKRRIYMIPYGEDYLRDTDYDYKTTTGTPEYWYWDDTTSKQVAFYSVPDANYNGRSLTYDYEREVEVTNVSDTIPVHSTSEFRAFIDMAARRFMYMVDQNIDIRNLSDDPIYKSSKAALYGLMKPVNPSKFYGNKYA